MKKSIEITLICIFAAVSLGATAVGIAGGKRNAEERLCTGLDAVVSDYPRNAFIDGEGVREVIDRDFGGYINKALAGIDTDTIEKLLLNLGYVEKCKVWCTADGILHIEASQRTPVLKLFLNKGLYYSDNEGRLFGVDDDWCEYLPGIEVKEMPQNEDWMRGVARFGQWLKDNEKWKSAVSSISCDKDGELVLSLSERPENFIFGQPRDIGTKFRRIGIYLEKIAPRGIEYKDISVKYKGQIICK